MLHYLRGDGIMRHCFYSFHYQADNWRAAKIRSIGAIHGSREAYDNGWEAVKNGSEQAIKNWIAAEMNGCSCAIVLIGEQTAGRKWIDYEIEQAWNKGMGLVGIYIHGVTDRNNQTSRAGINPFAKFNVRGVALSNIVRAYDPAGYDSATRYANISQNLGGWVEEAIAIRKRY
ncbi:TIR domain-containing protein [Pseudomonas sp. YL-218 TE3947]|uniref:TIR domain-containing protein n=1 Tax=Pseudomonas TaxID=286 RepID=UPI003D2119CD